MSGAAKAHSLQAAPAEIDSMSHYKPEQLASPVRRAGGSGCFIHC